MKTRSLCMRKVKQRLRFLSPHASLYLLPKLMIFFFFPFLLLPGDQNESYVLSYRAKERRTCVVLKQGAKEPQVLKGTFQVGPAIEWKMVLLPMQHQGPETNP